MNITIEGMGWGMVLVGMLVMILLILGIAALIKFLFSTKK